VARPATGDNPNALAALEICNEGDDLVGLYNPASTATLFGVEFKVEWAGNQMDVEAFSW
jgi:hypothetical protein